MSLGVRKFANVIIKHLFITDCEVVACPLEFSYAFWLLVCIHAQCIVLSLAILNLPLRFFFPGQPATKCLF